MTTRPVLAKGERMKLVDLEGIIERGLVAFVEVGAALMQIREQRLYRSTHDDFDSYCHDRWGWTASRARQLIGATEVVQQLESVTPVTPANERQARELAAVPEESRADVWETAKAEAKKPDKPTGEEVRRAAAPYKSPTKRRKIGPKEAADRATREANTPAATPSSPEPAEGIGESQGAEAGGEPDAHVERAGARDGSHPSDAHLPVTPDAPALTETGRPSSDEGSAGETTVLDGAVGRDATPASPTSEPVEDVGAPRGPVGGDQSPPSAGQSLTAAILALAADAPDVVDAAAVSIAPTVPLERLESIRCAYRLLGRLLVELDKRARKETAA